MTEQSVSVFEGCDVMCDMPDFGSDEFPTARYPLPSFDKLVVTIRKFLKDEAVVIDEKFVEEFGNRLREESEIEYNAEQLMKEGKRIKSKELKKLARQMKHNSQGSWDQEPEISVLEIGGKRVVVEKLYVGRNASHCFYIAEYEGKFYKVSSGEDMIEIKNWGRDEMLHRLYCQRDGFSYNETVIVRKGEEVGLFYNRVNVHEYESLEAAYSGYCGHW